MLEVVVKDVNGDRVGTWRRGMQVPHFPATNQCRFDFFHSTHGFNNTFIKPFSPE